MRPWPPALQKVWRPFFRPRSWLLRRTPPLPRLLLRLRPSPRQSPQAKAGSRRGGCGSRGRGSAPRTPRKGQQAPAGPQARAPPWVALPWGARPRVALPWVGLPRGVLPRGVLARSARMGLAGGEGGRWSVARAPARRRRRHRRAASRAAPPPSGPAGRDSTPRNPAPPGPGRSPPGQPGANPAASPTPRPPAPCPDSPNDPAAAPAVRNSWRGGGHHGPESARAPGRADHRNPYPTDPLNQLQAALDRDGSRHSQNRCQARAAGDRDAKTPHPCAQINGGLAAPARQPTLPSQAQQRDREAAPFQGPKKGGHRRAASA